MVSAAIARASFGVRSDWLFELGFGRSSPVVRGFSTAPPPAKLPLGRTLLCTSQPSPKAIDVAQNLVASFAQPDGHTPACGIDSFAELRVRAGDGGHTAGQQMDLRMPVLSSSDSVPGSGLRPPAADQDVALTAPSAYREETYV